jgi:hypothetical protein
VSFWHNQNNSPAATASSEDEPDALEGEVVSFPAESRDDHGQPSDADVLGGRAESAEQTPPDYPAQASARAGYGQDAVIGGFSSAGDADAAEDADAADATEDADPAEEAEDVDAAEEAEQTGVTVDGDEAAASADGTESAEPDGYDGESHVVVAEVIDVLPDDVGEVGPDDGAAGDDLAESGEPDVAEGQGRAATAFGTVDADSVDAADGSPPAPASAVPVSAAQADSRPHDGMADLGPQWHDIQASFVDDPRAAVDMAARAADAAVTALISAVRELQSALLPASDGEPDTEQLRVMLRGYRSFCQGIAEAERRLPEQPTASSG